MRMLCVLMTLVSEMVSAKIGGWYLLFPGLS